MIIFEKLRYKNFLGAGNAPIEILLNKSKTTLIIGTNGAGKSSGLLDGLSFVLFNKPFRSIKKPQLVNTINLKHCLVEVWFSIGQKKYLVKRGMKPDVFEIYCDDVLIDQVADSREYQRMLEDQILQMNSKTFNQVVLLSVVNFKPFMQLEAKDRRDVIEDILDIRVFSAMNQALKEKFSTLKENISIVDGNINVQKQKVDIQKSYIETLCQDQAAKEDSLVQQVAAATEKISALELDILSHTTIIEDLDAKIQDDSAIHTKKSKITPLCVPLKARVAKLQSTIDFYAETEICPSCSQVIDDEIKTQQIESTQTKMAEVNAAIANIVQQLAAIETRETEINEIKRKIHAANAAIQAINNQIIVEQTYIRKLNNELNSMTKLSGSIDTEKTKLKELADGALNLIRQKSELSESKQYLDIAATLLKDSGIKTKIIEQYLPVINKLINRYLAAMDTWISFNLDGEFNETIKSRYRDTFTYSSFSEGEKQRIDLAILFTWRTIAKMKNSVSTNLLVFDEVLDRALDSAGTDYVVQLLDTLGEGTNTFVISHKVAELQDKFHSTIKFDKVNNFSQIVV